MHVRKGEMFSLKENSYLLNLKIPYTYTCYIRYSKKNETYNNIVFWQKLDI